MPNTVPAATTGMPSSRRSILLGIASAPVLGLPALPAMAAPAAKPDVAGLWHAYLVAQGAATVADMAVDAAQARLPWWAAPGPDSIDHEGNECGEATHWPAIQDRSPSGGPGRYRPIRFGPQEIQEHFEWHRSQAHLDQAMAAHEARVAAQLAEWAAVGLPSLCDASDAAGEITYDVIQSIKALPSTSLDVIAAKSMLHMVMRCGTKETADTSDCMALLAIVLEGLAPALTGELAEDAAEIINNPTRLMGDFRVSRGIDAAMLGGVS